MSDLKETITVLPVEPESSNHTYGVGPDSSINEFDLQRLRAWNHEQPATVHECAHDLIQKQVNAQPDAIAVDAHDATFTYAELAAHSNRLAHRLVSLGAKPEIVIPLCFEKSAWAIVGLLGVLKSGAAMVFIDPSHPQSRREFITSQIEATMIVSSAQQRQLWDDSGLEVVVIDETTKEDLPASNEAPESAVQPTNLLYVIFTSGSTGAPKGCLIEHKSFCSGSIQHAAKAHIAPQSRVLQLASYSFDVSILEILTSLIHGACICTPSAESMSQGPAALINSFNVTWTFLTPSLVKLMSPADVPSLKTLALGGEALSKVDVETWAGHLQLINGYGPSECSIAATGNTQMRPDTDPANIGHPVGGICWVVDAEDSDKLVPIGSVGELLIEGPILARGYLKNPQKTDEAFIQRPCWGPQTTTGAIRRLYKTGDLARFNEDGSIHFVGRKDTQVKLRGLRIELGEIEHHIGSHPATQYATVLLPKEGPLHDRLVAVITLQDFVNAPPHGDVSTEISLLEFGDREAAETQLAQIRQRLASQVPEYMVPETWVVLERFPLLLSGKLNRSSVQQWLSKADEALFNEVTGLGNLEEEGVEPCSELELQICTIFSSVLNISKSQVSLSRSFLALGGDSISAMQVMTRCRSAGISITVKDILRSKTVTELASCAKEVKQATYSLEESLDTEFQLSPVQRMYFNLASKSSTGGVQGSHFNQSFFLKLTRYVEESQMRAALEAIVQRHSMLRARFVRSDQGEWSQKVLSQVSESFGFEINQIEEREEAFTTVSRLQTSLDFQTGPVFAASLFRLPDRSQLLFLVAHHIMIDLVSWRVILQELEQTINTGAVSAGRPMPFQNWLELQSEHEKKRVALSTALPFEIPNPDFSFWGMSDKANVISDTIEKKIILDTDSTTLLLGDACHRPLRTEPIDILLSALIHSFGSIFAERTLPALFREGHGREPWDDDIDISSTVGWFTTMYPLYLGSARYADIVETIKRAKDTRHSVPSNGRPYFASRYLNKAGIEAFGKHELVELSFDYLGLYQQLEHKDALLQQVAGYEATKYDVGPNVPRFALVEITAEVIAGKMQLSFVYNKAMKHQTRIENWIDECKKSLLSAVTCLPQLEHTWTLSDFPLLPLTYAGLSRLTEDTLSGLGIASQDVEDMYPCTPMQNGMIISQTRGNDFGFYEYFHTMKVTARHEEMPINLERLIAAWGQVVQRHPSLRTLFLPSVESTGLFVQVVLKRVDPSIAVLDPSGENDPVKLFRAQKALHFESAEVPHRVSICQSTDSEIYLRLDINHAIVDGSSIANILGDLIRSYDNNLALTTPGFSFGSFVAHTHEQSQLEAAEFWADYLDGAKPCLIPNLALREDAVDPEPRLNLVNIDVEAAPDQLTAFCAKHNVTLVNLFQLAWAIVLQVYTESNDVSFGYLASGRDVPLDGIEDGVGAFITMLICRITLEKDLSVNDALSKVADSFTRCLPHQYFGLSNMQHSLKLGGEALFNTIISFHKESDLDFMPESNIRVEGIEGHDPTEYAIALDIGVSERNVNIALAYWTSDFTHQQMENIGSTFSQALNAILQQTTEELRNLNIVSSHHIHQMQSFNSRRWQAVDSCVHQVIHQKALEFPENEALSSYEGSWTYKELDEASDDLAHRLVSLGIKLGDVVPYCFPKSAYAIISMLAILKAGGVGVAFDPAHPLKRLQGLISQVQASLILAGSSIVSKFDPVEGVTVIGVDTTLIESLPRSSGPAYSVGPSDLAMIVFTSGTTGKPKGIMLNHSVLCTCSEVMGEVLGFGPHTRALQFAAYTFDVSLQDIFTTLQHAGTICIISDDERMNDLSGGINRTRANWADITSTVANLLLPSDVPSLKRLNNGGEPLTREVVQKWAGAVELYNLYGPAETVINNTCSKRLSVTSNASNIGRAHAAHFWIVDEHDHNCLVPIGCVGEILIGGPMLADGYLNDPVKTSAAFIEDPSWSKFEHSSKQRFYKSGDLGAFNVDGSIHIVGRRDAQIKINGQRVELDEIMHAVQTRLRPGQEAAIDAVAVEEHTRTKTVVAYICDVGVSAGTSSEVIALSLSNSMKAELRKVQASLGNVLPAWMIPSVYVAVDRIPSTQNGKLDRRQLQNLVTGFSKEQMSQYMLESGTRAAPRTKKEEQLQKLCSQIFGISADQIGIDDNFFRLGGDSVGAMKLVSTARNIGLNLSVADIFAQPRLADIAAKMTDNVLPADTLATSEIKPFSLLHGDVSAIRKEIAGQCGVPESSINDAYPATALQESLLALSMGRNGAYVAQKVFVLPDSIEIERFKDAWETVIRKEDILRTRLVDSLIAGSMQVVIDKQQQWKSGIDLESYLADDLETSFEYGDDLLRLALVEQVSHDSVEKFFVWSAHHAIYDGWIVSRVFEKVAAAYSDCSVSPSIPFKHFIKHLASVDKTTSEEFWRGEFTCGSSEPTGFPLIPLGHQACAKQVLSFSASLKNPGNSGFPISTIIKAAWSTVQAIFSDSNDVVFACTLSGRDASIDRIEDLMGPTITTVPIRASGLNEDVSLQNVLTKFHTQATEMIPHEHFGMQNMQNMGTAAKDAISRIQNLLVVQFSDKAQEKDFLGLKCRKVAQDTFNTYALVIECNLGTDSELDIIAHFDEVVISGEQVKHMLCTLEHVANQFIETPTTRHHQIELLGRSDLELIRSWNREAPDFVNQLVHEVFEERAISTPNASAICSWDGGYTYAELDCATTKLAGHLQTLGVGPEVKVGLCFEKSKFNLLSMLAIAKAGGVCVQLLPNYPRTRMLSILEDIEALVVITTGNLASLFEGVVPNVLAINDGFVENLQECDQVISKTKPDNALFVVFTSGSTGKPKGVVVEHRGFLTMIKHQAPLIGLTANSRVFQFSSHIFDIFMFENFGSILTGACLCVPSEEERLSNLVGAINHLEANFLIMASTVADTFSPEEVPGLSHLVLGGEPLRPDIHAKWSSSTHLSNDYGPAECSVLAIMTRSTANTPPSMIGIGRGCRTWIVDKDDHDRLLPVGCMGELLIEGPIVARGYLNDPIKTAAAYITEPKWAKQVQSGRLDQFLPFPSDTSRMRIYKTGDLVRYGQDGNLHYITRKDAQIKIRGIRVELGEIEHHIKNSDFAAEDFAVEKVQIHGSEQNSALAAFIVPPFEGANASASSSINGECLPLSPSLSSKLQHLKDHIGQSLLPYLVPTIYIPLRQMPRTVTAKTDRKALRRLGAELSQAQLMQYTLVESERTRDMRLPETAMQRQVRKLWSEVLGLDEDLISVDDNFVKSGGDSIKAMRLAALARKSSLILNVGQIFSSPTVEAMAAIIVAGENSEPSPYGDLAPFELADGESTKSAAAQCNVDESSIEDIFPCTPLQEGLMALTAQHQNAYMAQRVFQLPEDLSLERFKDAWENVFNSNPILRTRIVQSKSSSSLQVVIRESITWYEMDSVENYLAESRDRTVTYGSPLTKFAVNDRARYFIWTCHHALYDGYSTNLLFSQLQAFYLQKEVISTTPYTRFIKSISDVNHESESAFWRAQLTGGSPKSFPEIITPSYQAAPDSELSKKIILTRKRRSEFMPSTILRAAWAIVTGKHVNSNDVTFAVTLSGRDSAVEGIDKICAPTITTAPLRLRMDSASPVVDFLHMVQKQATDMLPYQHTGLQNIHSMLPEQRGALNIHNLFVIQQSDSHSEELDMMSEVNDTSLLRGFHTYAVVMECVILDESEVRIDVQFDKSIIPPPLMQRVINHFDHVVGQLSQATASNKLCEIDLFGPSDFAEISIWNDPNEWEVVEDCVHKIFQTQARLRPNAQAVCAWDGNLTYSELDRISDRLASYLVEKGVTLETLVPMCFDKSAWVIVAMLAVLKAGGATCHLGATQPIRRMAQIIEETKATVILSDFQHAHLFKTLLNVEVIVIDPVFLVNIASVAPLPHVSQSNPAFTLFTSGSTGKPKGIVVEHGSLCTSSKAHGTNRRVGSDTRLFQFAAYTFDVSVADIFTTLQRGGCICIPSEDERTNDLAGAINRMNCNYAYLTPTVAGLLDPQAVPGLQTLILGGEMLTQDNIDTWAERVRLIVSYGMAECSIHCVGATPLTRKSKPANLGRASGCLFWIVDTDDHNKLAPIGCTGELVIEGRMVSRGYLNDQAKTEAAFITNPTWAESNGLPRRMYKTGDLVKYAEDGSYIYVSRKDFQVKHHGQRIELGEIEHHLLTDDKVQHAVVLLPKNGHCQNRLVGVLTLQDLAIKCSSREMALVAGLQREIANLQLPSIRKSLAARMPDYMIPAVWLVVSAIPLTPNGKMDRVNTRQWVENIDEKSYRDAIGMFDEEDDILTTQEEAQIRDILCDILHLPTISLKRSFLDLGGDSITAMQLRARCHTQDIACTVQSILKCESITQLAIEAVFMRKSDSSCAEIFQNPFGLSQMQKLYIRDLSDFDTEQVLVGVSAPIVLPRLDRAISAIVQRHSMLRARFEISSEDEIQQRITSDISGSYSLDAIPISQTSHIQERCAMLKGPNIQTGPILTAHVLSGSEKASNESYICFEAPRMILDSTAWSIFLGELDSAIATGAFSHAHPAPFQTWLGTSKQQASSSAYIIKELSKTEEVVETNLTFDAETTALALGACNNAFTTSPADILQTALAHSLSECMIGGKTLSVFSKDIGRIEPDQFESLRTLGCLEQLKLVYLDAGEDILLSLQKTKDQRILDQRPDVLEPQPLEVLLDLSAIEGGCSTDHEIFSIERDLGSLNTKRTRLLAPLEISLALEDGSLALSFKFARHIYQDDQISQWIQVAEDTVLALVHRLSSMEHQYTLSDFPLLPLNNTSLKELQKSLGTMGLEQEDIESVAPCAPVQNRMLLSQQSQPGTYHTGTVQAITSPGTSEGIDMDKLKAAWQKVTDRHEALRTIFIPSSGREDEFDQVILRGCQAPVHTIDCEDDKIGEIMQKHNSFSYNEPRPHVQFTLFRAIQSNSVYCKLEISHALQDGMSTRIIYRDLVLAYEDELAAGSAAGFRDYVAWTQKQDLSSDIAFWDNYLSGIEPSRLPRTVLAQSVSLRTRQNDFITIPIKERTSEIKTFCRQNSLTTATLFQTAWVLTLRHFTTSNNVLFGYMTANRDVPISGIDEIVGPLINMLLCRIDIEASTTSLISLLKKVHDEFLECLPHQHGFVQAVQNTLLKSEQPVWNTVLSLEYANESRSAALGEKGTSLDFKAIWGTRSPEYDVVMGVLIHEDYVETQLGYWDDVMTKESMQEVASKYAELLSTIIGEPDMLVAAL